MGVSFIKLSGGSSWCNNPVNPVPSVFEILKIEQVNNFVVAVIKYPNCTNFEGKKILVFRNSRVEEILKMQEIDPHFYESSKLVARFAPTQYGYNLALNMCNNNVDINS